MKPSGPIKLVSQLLDLPLIDSEGCYCGIVDDVELGRNDGKEPTVDALLVGPGAYSGRLPAWAMGLVRMVAGGRMVRVPFKKIQTIGAAVQLSCAASEVGLGRSEEAARRWIPHRGAL